MLTFTTTGLSSGFSGRKHPVPDRPEDKGEPGTSDTFQIEIWQGVVDKENGPPVPKHRTQGVLGGGNIKFH